MKTSGNKIPLTYAYLEKKLEWVDFCELTGTDYYAILNGMVIKDEEVFWVDEVRAKELELI